MAKIVVLGAGIGGVPMAYEMKEIVGKEHEVVVISDTPTFHFVPSNPWVPPKWRKPEDLKIELAPVMAKKGINFIQKAATKVDPVNNKVDLADGSSVEYDYLVIATGPRLAFDEVPGLALTVVTPPRFVTSIMPPSPLRIGTDLWPILGPSSLVRYKARPASVPLTNI